MSSKFTQVVVAAAFVAGLGLSGAVLSTSGAYAQTQGQMPKKSEMMKDKKPGQSCKSFKKDSAQYKDCVKKEAQMKKMEMDKKKKTN